MSDRRKHPMLVLGVLALVPALALAAIWRLADTRAAQGSPPELTETTPETATGTSVLSVRRAPGTLAVDAALPALAFQLDPVVAQIDDQSCVSVSVTSREVAATGEDRSLLPASNVKLVTGAVALDVIGTDFRYVTELRGVVDGGTVQGDLFFVGGGDPLLAVASYPGTQRLPPEPRTPLEDLVTGLQDAGVTSVTGAVVGVESRYDAERYVDTWGDGIRGTEAGPLGALLVNDGVVTGNPVKPSEPALAASIELTRLLNEAGITVGALPRIADPAIDQPDGVPVISEVESAPFSEVLGEMLTNSDNNTAELVLKEIAVQSDRSGTRVDGLAVVNERLTSWGIPLEGVVLVDASGLDRNNRLTCRAVLTLLEQQDLDGPFGQGLAVAGETGTMSLFFEGTPLDGTLRAKTGTLTGAKAFSGFLPSSGGVELRYSLLLNGEVTTQCNVSQCPPFEALARALATYPGGAPDPSVLGPRP